MSKLLAQGGYGCVFRPELQCSGKSGTDKRVSKLQKNNYAAINEYKIGLLIRTIKRYDKYFLPATSMCPVKLSKINNNILKPCDIINQKYKYNLLSFPFLENYGFLNFFSSTKRSEFYMIEMYEGLVKSLHLLYNKNIVHHDIKDDNILIKMKTREPIIIDYGISMNMTNVNKSMYEDMFYIYAPEYYPWCIEQHVICYIVQYRLHVHDYSDLRQEELHNIINAYTRQTVFSIFSDTFVQKYNKSLKHTLSCFINTRPQHILDTLIKDYSSWDLVALSIMFIKLIKYTYEFKTLPKRIVSLLKILLLNISPNRKKRLSHEKTLENINQLKHLNKRK